LSIGSGDASFWHAQVDLAAADWRVLSNQANELKSRGRKPITPDQVRVRSKMDMPADFFARRLASIEKGKAGRLATIEEEKAAQAQVDRLNQQIPLILDCIEKMSLAGISETEIADLFRHAADELEKIHGPGAAEKPQHRQK
jgi:hypothetical protein